MTTDPVAFVPALSEPSLAPTTAAPAAGDFGTWLAQAVARTNSDLVAADQGMQALASGEAQNLHQVMIKLEEARIGVQLLVQVRNRLLDAYQEILRMQV